MHHRTYTDLTLSHFIHNTGERVICDCDGVAVCWRAGVVVRLRDDYAGEHLVFFFLNAKKS